MIKSKAIFVILLVISISNFVIAGKPPIKFGKISEEEINMNVCPIDSNASAFVIADIGSSKFQILQDDINLIFTRHVRIKVLGKESFDKGNFSIYLYKNVTGDKEEVTNVKGVVYNMVNGHLEKTKLTNDHVFSDNINKSRNVTKITMPNVKEGSIIDLTYTVKSPFIFNLESWYFQDDIPTLYSEYEVANIEWYNYKNWVEGYLIVDKDEMFRNEKFSFVRSSELATKPGEERRSGGIVEFNANVTYMTYRISNVPAFKDEPYITTKIDYLSSVHFELQSTQYPWSQYKNYTTTWEKINKLLLEDEDFGRTLKSNGHLEDIAQSIKSKSQSDLELAINAYEHIKKYMTWDGRYSVSAEYSIKKAYNEKGGTSADINLNLVALARRLGLEAYPVIISTRNHGKVRPGQPTLTQFNHTIAALKNGENFILMDATDPNCPYNLLPANSLNGKGRLVDETNGQWIELYTSTPKKEVYMASLLFNDNLELTGKYTYKASEYGALLFREKYNKEETEEDFVIELEEKLNDVELSDLQIDNIDSLHKPVVVNAQIKVTNGVNAIGDMIYLTPKVINRYAENVFKAEERTYPIDYNFPVRKQHMITIQIPDGYAVEEIPSQLMISLPDKKGKYIYSVKTVGNNIQLINQFAINQTIFPGTEYSEIKKFHEMIVAKEAEQIVLKKLN